MFTEQQHGADVERLLVRRRRACSKRTANGRCCIAAASDSCSKAIWSDDWLAALAAFLDCGFEPHDALVLALAWRAGDETQAETRGPSISLRFRASPTCRAAPAQAFPRCPERLGLYPVLPSAEWVERVLDLGVKTAQLRRKSTDADDLKREIERCGEPRAASIRRRCSSTITGAKRSRRARTACISARKTCRPPTSNAIAQAGVRLGLSTHGYYEMLRALHFRPSYLALGAVFPTTTKVMPTAPQGLARLARYVRLLDGACRWWRSAASNGDVLARGAGDRRRQRGGRARGDRSSRTRRPRFLRCSRSLRDNVENSEKLLVER